MSTDIYKAVTAALVLLSIILSAALARSCRTSGKLRPPDIQTVTDTVLIRDTAFIEKPEAESVATVDTILVRTVEHVPGDTVRITDTVYVRLPIEQRHYSGKEYDAWISGYRPRLDSIRIYRNTLQLTGTSIVQTQTRPKRWGIGIQIGYGMTLTPSPQFHPYIGIGISYDILSF